MISRGTVIAALIGIEIAIAGEMVVAARGERPEPSPARRAVAEAAAGPNLVEGGAHRLFDASARAKVVVEIGYADLTVLTSTAPQIDVALDKSTDFGLFRATGPISVRRDGDTIRIARTEHRFSAGDDRMLTVLVPAGTTVTVVDAGNIHANGLRADASFHSIGNGTVTIEDYQASQLHVTTSRGDISLHQIAAGRLTAVSRDGSIQATALRVHDGSVQSASDTVRLGFANGSDTLVTANTDDGAIHVSGFPESAVVPAAHTSGGDASSQSVRVGAGGGRLDVHSGSGDIDIRQEG